jgi:DNA-binding response OmpR family regulator
VLADRVLVVDDEADIVSTAKMILETEGYHVVTASTGVEGLLKADSEVPDLILLDLVMPDKSGLEVCRILKSQANTKHIPVVLFTALGRDVDRKMGADAGADCYFTKPFTPDALTEEVRKQLDRVRIQKFSKQLGVEHGKLRGKKLLLEFDPSTPYERLIRDFALECAAHDEAIILMTKKGSAIRQALQGEQNVEFIDVTSDLMLSQIVERHIGHPLSLVYDSLTDLSISTNPQTAYKFASSAIEHLSDPEATAVFLLNPAAHDSKDTYSMKGLFNNQATYGKQGVTNVRIV